MDILQNDFAVLFKFFKVMKHEERMGKCFRLKETKETRPRNRACDLRLDPEPGGKKKMLCFDLKDTSGTIG